MLSKIRKLRFVFLAAFPQQPAYLLETDSKQVRKQVNKMGNVLV